MGRGKRHTPEEAVLKMREIDVIISQGKSMKEAERCLNLNPLNVFSNIILADLDSLTPEGQIKAIGHLEATKKSAKERSDVDYEYLLQELYRIGQN